MRQNLQLTRSIVELINFQTGLEESSLDLLNSDEESIVKLRYLIEESINKDSILYGCGFCGQPVVIRCHRRSIDDPLSYYFKHQYASGDCPIKTDSTYTRDEVLRMKYNGAKESAAHADLKYYLANQLQSDDKFSDIKVEKVIRSKGWSKNWKKPDISASFNGRPVVFEIQLSTTFLDVIVSREIFYQDQEISIFWIFHKLNPEKARATEKDVFFNNHANALSISEESKEISKRMEETIFIGHYKQPFFNKGIKSVDSLWQEKEVSFKDIKFDEKTKKPYFFKFDEEEKKVIENEKLLKIQSAVDFLQYTVLLDNPSYDTKLDCIEKLKIVGIYDDNDLPPKLLNFLRALISVRDEKIYFSNQEGKWSWLVNYVYDHHIEHWLVFLFAVKAYEKNKIVFDKNNQKVSHKRMQFKKDWENGHPPKQNALYYTLFGYVLPKISENLENHRY